MIENWVVKLLLNLETIDLSNMCDLMNLMLAALLYYTMYKIKYKIL